VNLDNLLPLIYLLAVTGIAVGLRYAGVDDITTGLIIGAGLTRVKKPSPPAEENGK
jgi:hypothetical protein